MDASQYCIYHDNTKVMIRSLLDDKISTIQLESSIWWIFVLEDGLIATYTTDSSLLLYDRQGEQVEKKVTLRAKLTCITQIKPGMLVMGFANGDIARYQFGLKLDYITAAHSEKVRNVRCLDGDRFVSYGYDGKVNLWNAKTCSFITKLQQFPAHSLVDIARPNGRGLVITNSIYPVNESNWFSMVGSLITGSIRLIRGQISYDISSNCVNLYARELNQNEQVQLVNALQYTQSVTELNLRGTPMRFSLMNALLQTLSINNSIKILNLNNCQLTDNHLKQLILVLDQNSTIKKLYVRNNPDCSQAMKSVLRNKLNTRQESANNKVVISHYSFFSDPRNLPRTKITADRSKCLRILVKKTNILRGEVGHVALQTFGENGEYMSYYPNSGNKIDKLLKPVPGVFNELAYDAVGDVEIVDLYSLDVDIVNNLFREFKQSNCNWQFLSRPIFRNTNTHNCSTMVMYLLHRAGIQGLLNDHQKSFTRYGAYADFGIAVFSALSSIAIIIQPSLRLSSSVAYKAIGFLAAVNIPISLQVGFMQRNAGYLGTAVDFFRNRIFTPDNVLALAQEAKRNEVRQFELTEADVSSSSSAASSTYVPACPYS